MPADADLTQRVEEALDASFLPGRYDGATVAVAIPDATRPLSYTATLTPLLERLRDAGAASLTVIVALGLHRPMREDELGDLRAICARFGATLTQSAPHDGALTHEVCADAGLWEAPPPDGSARALPVRMHRVITEADRIVCTGLVEPHQYAGFSGGVKTVSLGCAGADTISVLHGLTYLRDPRTRLGRLEDNPFRAALRRIATHLPPMDALQVVLAPEHPPHVVYGEAVDALRRAAARAEQVCFEDHTTRYAWMHLPVPAAKGTNVYQASRAASYVALVDRPALKEGAWLVVEAPCPEGMGEGAGERHAAAAIQRGRAALLAELRGDEDRALKGGEQRAYVIASVLDIYNIALIGAVRPIDPLRAIGIPQYPDLAAARRALGLDAHAGCTIEDVFHRVPRYADE